MVRPPQSPGLTVSFPRRWQREQALEAEPLRTAPSATLERAIRAAIPPKRGAPRLAERNRADDPTPLLFGDAIPSVFNAIRAMPYDFVVVDTPPAFGVPDIRALAPHADAFLVVVRTHRLRMSQAVELRDLLDAFDKEKLGLAVFERRRTRQPVRLRREPTRRDRGRTAKSESDGSSSGSQLATVRQPANVKGRLLGGQLAWCSLSSSLR